MDEYGQGQYGGGGGVLRRSWLPKHHSRSGGVPLLLVAAYQFNPDGPLSQWEVESGAIAQEVEGLRARAQGRAGDLHVVLVAAGAGESTSTLGVRAREDVEKRLAQLRMKTRLGRRQLHLVMGGDCGGSLSAVARSLDLAQAGSAQEAAAAGAKPAAAWSARGVDPRSLSDAFRGVERAMRSAAMELVYQRLEGLQLRTLRLVKGPQVAVSVPG